MRIQIDTKAKTIKVEESIDLGEFFKQIKKLVPDWEEYKLETNTVIYNWSYPMTYYPISPYIPSYPSYPTYPIICGTGVINLSGNTCTTLIGDTLSDGSGYNTSTTTVFVEAPSHLINLEL